VKASRARNFPTIAYANVIRNGDGKPLFTGVTQIYEELKSDAPEAKQDSEGK
jgi:hypothetical protein